MSFPGIPQKWYGELRSADFKLQVALRYDRLLLTKKFVNSLRPVINVEDLRQHFKAQMAQRPRNWQNALTSSMDQHIGKINWAVVFLRYSNPNFRNTLREFRKTVRSMIPAQNCTHNFLSTTSAYYWLNCELSREISG